MHKHVTAFNSGGKPEPYFVRGPRAGHFLTRWRCCECTHQAKHLVWKAWDFNLAVNFRIPTMCYGRTTLWSEFGRPGETGGAESHKIKDDTN
jgi:hypothetical protein